MNIIHIEGDNEATSYPWWIIIDPRQQLVPARDMIHHVASQVTGPFFSRQEAQEYLDNHRYNYGKHVGVYCMSGHKSASFRQACDTANWVDQPEPEDPIEYTDPIFDPKVAVELNKLHPYYEIRRDVDDAAINSDWPDSFAADAQQLVAELFKTIPNLPKPELSYSDSDLILSWSDAYSYIEVEALIYDPDGLYYYEDLTVDRYYTEHKKDNKTEVLQELQKLSNRNAVKTFVEQNRELSLAQLEENPPEGLSTQEARVAVQQLINSQDLVVNSNLKLEIAKPEDSPKKDPEAFYEKVLVKDDDEEYTEEYPEFPEEDGEEDEFDDFPEVIGDDYKKLFFDFVSFTRKEISKALKQLRT